MKNRFLPFAFVLLCGVMAACSKENEQDLTGPVVITPVCDTANMKLLTNVVPLFTANHCYECHGNGNNDGGVRLDVYNNLKTWSLNGKLLAAINHTGPYHMPQGYAKMSDCDINKIKDWIDRGALNN